MVATRTKRTGSKKNISDIVTDVTQAPPQDEKVRKVKAAYKEKAVTDSASLTIEKVTQSLTKAGLDISKTLSSVRDLFESEISALQIIKEAIEAKQEELEELYDKEVVAASLTDLALQYEAQKAILLKTQEESRKVWEKEQTDHTLSVRERNEVLLKDRTRENEEYEYKKSITRRNEEESWKATHTRRVLELQQTEQTHLKNWQEREELLKKQEAEIAAAKAKIDGFDATVKSEVDRQVAIASNAIKSRYETEAKIKALEYDGEKKLLERDNEILKGLVGARDKEIASLRTALEKKDSEVKEVAVAAMNAQSGRQALSAVQESLQSQSGKK